MLPPEFTVIVDTREQTPWDVGPNVIRKKLSAGDYSLLGFETEISIERKSTNDLVQTLVSGLSRFKRELQRLGQFAHACVVVKASEVDIRHRRYYVDVDPESVLLQVTALTLEFNIPFYFAGNRDQARDFGLRMLSVFYARQRYGSR